jgi:hypothetical protein
VVHGVYERLVTSSYCLRAHRVVKQMQHQSDRIKLALLTVSAIASAEGTVLAVLVQGVKMQVNQCVTLMEGYLRKY